MKALLVVSLFRLIEVAKNLGCYPIANWAFRLLLWLNWNAKENLLVTEVETENYEFGDDDWKYPFVMGQGYYIDHHDSYYDLLILRYEAEYACIPMPLVQVDNLLWFALERAVFKGKQEHNRVTLWQKFFNR